jgi:acyl dehydratase
MSATAPEQKTASIDPELAKRIAAFAGAGADRRGFDALAPVSVAVIKQMTDAVGDRNPVYTDEAFARNSIHKGLVAPPLWIYSWMMPGLAGEAEQAFLADGTPYHYAAPGGQRRTPAQRTLRDELNDLLEAHGFTSPAVTNMSYTFARYLRPGETPRFSSWIIEDIVGPKVTKIGEGFFATMRIDVFVGEEPVATIRQRYLRSKPFVRKGAAEPTVKKDDTDSPPPAALPDLRFAPRPDFPVRTLPFSEVKAGDTLPALTVKISPTLIIAGALASQDFQDVHHDHQMIRRRGHPDIFMNMMTSSGLLGRYLTDWTGPDALIRAHELRLGRPNYAGDTMRLTGSVRSAELVEGRGLVTVDVVGVNSLGNHAEGSMTFELPR